MTSHEKTDGDIYGTALACHDNPVDCGIRNLLTFIEESRDDIVLTWLQIFKSAEYMGGIYSFDQLSFDATHHEKTAKDYLTSGMVHIIDQGKNLIAGYTKYALLGA